ncbi:MAG: metal ABC transporter ATP-binding protein [Pseudoflavonifractor sp.]|nr:metal ABC transporter ATP-binding protein [Alloprevotella sp.]MCM1117186.1 metal ABC transporter ATP-binding protein [Pseudoflavonifractor sp.]
MTIPSHFFHPSPAIRLEAISVSYDRRPPVLDNVSIDINRGDFMAITGPNGGGKTTLLRIILKLLKPNRGRVAYLGPDGQPAPKLSIGYLPQKSAVDSRFPISVADVVRLGLMGPRRVDNPDRRVSEMLSLVELSAKASAPICEVSGGQLQRALLARALASCPDVLVLDEPLSYLDKHFEQKLYDILRLTMEQRPQTAILLVSHEMSEIAAMATRHIIVDHKVTVCHSASHLVHYDCET